jgi:excisionase family DNA binding protein
MIEKLLLRPEEAAEAIGFRRSTAYALIRSGELPSILVNGSIRVPADALRQWVERRAKDAASQPTPRTRMGSTA